MNHHHPLATVHNFQILSDVEIKYFPNSIQKWDSHRQNENMLYCSIQKGGTTVFYETYKKFHSGADTLLHVD